MEDPADSRAQPLLPSPQAKIKLLKLQQEIAALKGGN
jgi:hypothetical protein